jgi:hypothetical protein
MATTRPTLASLARQTERLLLQASLCPTHPRERLWCTHQLSWEGTEAEFDAFVALAARLPFDRVGGPTPHTCAACHERLWCDACCREVKARRPLREVTMPLSDAEIATYQRLSAYLTLKDRDQAPGLPPIRLHWGDPTPPEATETEPPRVVTEMNPCSSSSPEAPELEPAPAPVPAPTPAPTRELEPEPVDDGDDEADVDAELADLLAQLQRRLGR